MAAGSKASIDAGIRCLANWRPAQSTMVARTPEIDQADLGRKQSRHLDAARQSHGREVSPWVKRQRQVHSADSGDS
jgi:hypothetical protein